MHLPIYFDGQLVRCLVVGGGTSVIRKIELFLEAGATVNVIAPQADFKIVVLASLARVKWEQRECLIEDTQEYDLVIIGKEDVTNSKELIADLRKRNIPVNVCDDPASSTFFVPAILREGGLTVAASTTGQAPFMAIEFIRRLSSAVKGWSNWLKLASRYRIAVIRSTKDAQKRRDYYDKFIQAGPVEIEPLPSEKTTMAEWQQIMRHSTRSSASPRTAPPPSIKPGRTTGFLPRSTYAAGYSAVETDDIPPPDEVGVFTQDAPNWEERYAAEPRRSYMPDTSVSSDDEKDDDD